MEFIVKLINSISIIEWISFVFALLQVTYSYKNHISNYIYGIISILLTLYIMYNSKLYAEFTLNMYYLIMSIYGIYNWKYGSPDKTTINITYSDVKDFIISIGISFGTFTIFMIYLTYFTNSDVPVWDSAVSGFAWAGMWLLAKRKMENWIFLNISNIISIPLMIYKGLYLYALLSLILFIIAVFGYFNWKKMIKN